MISNTKNAEKLYDQQVFTWVQSLLSAHQRVGTDDVDEAAGASFDFVHQEGQIVQLVLNKQTIKNQNTSNYILLSIQWV